MLAVLGACDQAPSTDGLPEWKPADHHSSDDNAGGGTSGQQAPAARGQGAQGSQAAQVSQLVEVAWQQECVKCHGPMGQGNGQMGVMLHARDLTDPDWQAKTSDAQMAASIKNGKDKMPKYDLPDPVVAGLVARIRQLKGG
jgi:cytochrome c oxidase cbb3-type subunit 3